MTIQKFLKTTLRKPVILSSAGWLLIISIYIILKLFDRNSTDRLYIHELVICFIAFMMIIGSLNNALASGKLNVQSFRKRFFIRPIIGSIFISYIAASAPKYSILVFMSLFLMLFLFIGLWKSNLILATGILTSLMFFVFGYWFNQIEIKTNLLYHLSTHFAFLMGYFFFNEMNKFVASQIDSINRFLRVSRKDKRSLYEEKQKSEKLILNILPAEIATELKENGFNEPVQFELASVLFTDFKGFTKIAETMTPKELVVELDLCFSYFDSLMDRYNLEKLKTIGDSFMCTGGIPIPNNTHAIDCTLAGLEIQAFMNQMKALKEQQNMPYWELRLGIHSGSLVAGVIGEKKFAYDVWGDTVNTASRAESSGMVGRINVTKTTYKLVKDFFTMEHRGTVEAKNKGAIDMYFVNGIHPELSRNGEGRVPNDEFLNIYREMELSITN